MTDERMESQWWYNTETHQVEEGMQSPNRQRVGPYATREEAQHALDQIAANNERWDREN